MGVDNFADNSEGLKSPGKNAAAISLSDTVDLPIYSRALFVGVGGNISVLLVGDTNPVLLKNVASGQLLPLRVKRVYAATTATDLVAIW